MFADAGETGYYRGYYFRYTILKTEKENGMDNVVSFMICAWPKIIDKSGTKFYITNESCVVYERPADPKIDVPLTEWQDEKTLESDWKPAAR